MDGLSMGCTLQMAISMRKTYDDITWDGPAKSGAPPGMVEALEIMGCLPPINWCRISQPSTVWWPLHWALVAGPSLGPFLLKAMARWCGEPHNHPMRSVCFFHIYIYVCVQYVQYVQQNIIPIIICIYIYIYLFIYLFSLYLFNIISTYKHVYIMSERI